MLLLYQLDTALEKNLKESDDHKYVKQFVAFIFLLSLDERFLGEQSFLYCLHGFTVAAFAKSVAR